MALYAKIADFEGDVKTKGFEKHIELYSFNFGIGRHFGSPTRGSQGREGAEVHVSEITITKHVDSASPKLFLESLQGKHDNKVAVSWTTTKADQVATYLKIELEGTAISGYSVAGGGGETDTPTESITLNFTKIQYTYTAYDEHQSGKPDRAGWDLEAVAKM